MSFGHRHMLARAFAVASLFGLAISTLANDRPTDVQQTQKSPAEVTKSFMRQKLGSTNKILEGIASENFDLVIQGSDELLHIAEEASWRVRRDPYYMLYSRDFKQTMQQLQDATRRKNVEQATFAFTHATVSCTACHRHVRGAIQVSQR